MGWTALAVTFAGAALLGSLLGGRAALQAAARDAAAAVRRGDPAQAVAIDDAIADASGYLTALDGGASAQARDAGQAARLDWAGQLAAAGRVDEAIAVLERVDRPGLRETASRTRARLLLDAAAAALASQHPELALQRLDQAQRGSPPPDLLGRISAMRVQAEVATAGHLAMAGRGADALVLLDDAAAHGVAVDPGLYAGTLLAAGRQQLAAQSFVEATATLRRLIAEYPRHSEARAARLILAQPQTVSGTLVDQASRPVSGQVRLSSHFSSLGSGYSTYGPFYYGISDIHGDLRIAAVPVGGPYVLEYYRNGGWETLVEPHTGQPANPVSVVALTPTDLGFIVLP